MPTYQYKCQSCGYIFEQFSSISSYHKELDCPVCQNAAGIYITGGTGLIFKGSGFYITDYQKKNGKSNNGNK